MFPLSEIGRFSGVRPAQRPRARLLAAILENLLDDPTCCLILAGSSRKIDENISAWLYFLKSSMISSVQNSIKKVVSPAALNLKS